jgi:hypothetical protein
MKEFLNNLISATANPNGAVMLVLVTLFIITAGRGALQGDGWLADMFGPKASLYEIGDSVINKDEVRIRQAAGGTVLGTQPKFETGEIVQGPVMRSGKEWWRINYEEAPDGWVISSDVSNKVAIERTVHAVPITLTILRPIFVVLSIIAAVLLFVVVLKAKAFAHMQAKKAEQEAEQKIIKQGNTPQPDIRPADEVPEELPVANLPVGDAPKTEDVHNKRWANIQSLIRSYNANDWKQAIIEADIILDEMLKRMGYKGQSIGDRLKTIEPSDFMTLDQAWEAHKFRNRIAHGSQYVLTKDEAERIIKLYEEVFSEFFFI